jgi:hypothetical protein
MVGYCFLHSTSRYEGPYPPLVEDQQCIGWNQLLFGRWSTLWTTHQTSYIQRRNIHVTSTNQGDGWSSQVIALIWKHCYQAWIDRNHALHGHTRQTKNLARCHRAQYRLRALYDLKHQCSQFVCNFWFYPSLDEHLNQIQPNLKTGLRQTKLGFIDMSHTATPTTAPDSSTSRTSSPPPRR